MRHCAICGSDEIHPWFVTDFGSIGRCGKCRQVLRADRPRRDGQLVLHQTSNLHNTPYATLAAQASEELAFYGKFLDLFHWEGARVLEVGVGTGEFLKRALERGLDAVGIEPIAEVREMTEERLGVRGRIDSHPVEKADYGSQNLDGVAMDVIEHLVDPLGVLVRLHEMIKPGGWLGVATINHDSLMYGLYHLMRRAAPPLARRFGPLLYNPFHTYYFTKVSLKRLVRNAGFRVIEHRGYEFPLSRLDAGPLLKLGMRALYLAQGLLGAQGEQYLFARRS